MHLERQIAARGDGGRALRSLVTGSVAHHVSHPVVQRPLLATRRERLHERV